MEDDFVTVVETLDGMEANFCRAFLEGNGFEVQQYSRERIPGLLSPTILEVRERDVTRALKFLQELRQSEVDTDESTAPSPNG